MAAFSFLGDQICHGKTIVIHKTFKACVLTKVNQPLELMELQIPQAFYSGQVLVKLKKAGLCRSQLMEARGHRGKDKYLPHLLGHEGVGYVIQVAPDVTKVKPGDRVILGWLKGSGLDSGGCTLTTTYGEKVNAGPVTTFSEYSLISENRLTVCPDDITDEVAVLLGCALPTGAGIVLNQVKPNHYHDVLLIGLGGIGLSALLMLKHLKPKTITVIDANPDKIKLAQKLGVDQAYVLRDETQAEITSKFPTGFDYAIECAGQSRSIELAFELLNNTGTCIFASHPPNGEKIQLDPHALICGKKIIGSWGGNSNPDTDLAKIGRILQNMSLPDDLFVSHRFSLDEINDAFDALERGDVIRVMIEFN